MLTLQRYLSKQVSKYCILVDKTFDKLVHNFVVSFLVF